MTTKEISQNPPPGFGEFVVYHSMIMLCVRGNPARHLFFQDGKKQAVDFGISKTSIKIPRAMALKTG